MFLPQTFGHVANWRFNVLGGTPMSGSHRALKRKPPGLPFGPPDGPAWSKPEAGAALGIA